jgi:hypothetical protein
VVEPATNAGEVSATDTDATGFGAGTVTAIVAEALLPSLLAVIEEVPCVTPVTIPAGLTKATCGLDELY